MVSLGFSLLLFAIPIISSTKLPYHSFEPPFNEVDGAGDRMVNKFWRTSGHTGTVLAHLS